jgi:hypothetical protein
MPSLQGKGIHELIHKVKDIKIKENHKKRNADNKISFEYINIIIKLKYAFYNYIMSSVSDHVQLMKSQENKYDSVFNKQE